MGSRTASRQRSRLPLRRGRRRHSPRHLRPAGQSRLRHRRRLARHAGLCGSRDCALVAPRRWRAIRPRPPSPAARRHGRQQRLPVPRLENRTPGPTRRCLGLTLTVAHYPTGASKWNPIEHRLFSEISKNWAGEPLDSYQKILRFIRSTRTQSGLSVTAHLDRRHYPTGVEPAPEQLQALRLQPGDILPNWNYTISPNL